MDVHFDAFMTDEMDNVEHIYKVAGLAMTNEARAQIGNYAASHPRGKEGQVDYDLRADFGVEPEQVRAEFAFYQDAVGVREEVR